MAVGYPVIERWRVDLFFYIGMAVEFSVIERWRVDRFFYMSMAVEYPVIERWRVDRFFLYIYGCYISSDREMERSSFFL